MVVVKYARILSDWIQCSSSCTECPTVSAVRVGGTEYVWSRVVYLRMDGKSCKVEEPVPTAVDDFAVMAHVDEVIWSDEREVKAYPY